MNKVKKIFYEPVYKSNCVPVFNTACKFHITSYRRMKFRQITHQ